MVNDLATETLLLKYKRLERAARNECLFWNDSYCDTKESALLDAAQLELLAALKDLEIRDDPK